MKTDLREFHNEFSSVKWKLTKDGVFIQGSGIERTKGKPVTTSRIWNDFKSEIISASTQFHITVEIIIATIATESGGYPFAHRFEKGYSSDLSTPHRASYGLMQTLVSTAQETLINWNIKQLKISKYSSLYYEKIKEIRQRIKRLVNQHWLFVAQNSINSGTCYIREQDYKTDLDPPKVACAYNSGGIYAQLGYNNRWKMKQHPIGTSKHTDKFVKWFNDAVEVISLDKSTESIYSHCVFVNELS
jgi:hypothetical protein